MAAMGAKRSKKSKSKRVTLKQKYKMIKKVMMSVIFTKHKFMKTLVCTSHRYLL